jgi:hypothetical protein
MSRLARFLAIIMLAAFAASTAKHAAHATSMALAMSDAGMNDCDGCPPPDDGEVLACGQACLAPFAALPAASGPVVPVAMAEATGSPVKTMAGRTGPPDPYPPRTAITD